MAKNDQTVCARFSGGNNSSRKRLLGIERIQNMALEDLSRLVKHQ